MLAYCGHGIEIHVEHLAEFAFVLHRNEKRLPSDSISGFVRVHRRFDEFAVDDHVVQVASLLLVKS